MNKNSLKLCIVLLGTLFISSCDIFFEAVVECKHPTKSLEISMLADTELIDDVDMIYQRTVIIRENNNTKRVNAECKLDNANEVVECTFPWIGPFNRSMRASGKAIQKYLITPEQKSFNAKLTTFFQDEMMNCTLHDSDGGDYTMIF